MLFLHFSGTSVTEVESTSLQHVSGSGSEALAERQVFVEKINDSFNPPGRPFVSAVRSTMLDMMGQYASAQTTPPTEVRDEE